MMRRLPLPSLAVAIVIAALSAGCGNPGECAGGASCRPNPTSEALDATVRARFAPPTGIAATFVAEASRPPVVIGTATPELPTSMPPTATLVPTFTATFMPPDPSRVTPHPTDPPFTPHPRPRMPVASDIHAGADGKYVADVDECHWAEYGRFPVVGSADVTVGMHTPCLPYEWLQFNPRTGEVEHFIA